MMRDWIKRGILLVAAMAAVLTFEWWYFSESFEGIVLRVEENAVLVARNLNFEEEDYKQSYIQWFLGDYELIEVTNVSDIPLGSRIHVNFDGRTLSPNALTVSARNYSIYHREFSAADNSVPVISHENIHCDLKSIFPIEEGVLQVFGGKGPYAFVQRLNAVNHTSDSLHIQFDGHENTAPEDSEGFHLTYNIQGDSITEFIHNTDSDQGLGSGTLLHSIIERKTVLQAPFEVGNTWTNTFIFEGQFLEAVTEIVRIEETPTGKEEIETRTVVEEIEGFPGNRYEETRIFLEGSGMTHFLNSPRIGENNFFMFGFSLATEKMDN